MYVDEFIDTTDYVPQRLLQVNNCGTQGIARHVYDILRSKGRKDYHFLYVVSGWLLAEVGNVKVRLNAGECVVFFPGVRQMYTFCKEGQSITLFLHFTGAMADEAMKSLQKRPNMTYKIEDCTAFEGLFRQLISIHNLRDQEYILEENGILLQLIAIVARSSIEKKPEDRHSDILYSCAFIKEHYAEQIDLAHCAATLNLSPSRYSHLFTQTVGISPYKYLTKLRIDHAKGLLSFSSMNINEISDEVGFEDALYFSRQFKKYVGCSPSQFRDVEQLKNNS